MIQHQQQLAEQNEPEHPQYIPSTDDDRKFAEKPNALKKVALDDIDDDLQTNQLQDGGFSWSNMLGKPFFLNSPKFQILKIFVIL